MKDPIFHRLLQLHPKFSDLSLGRINQLLKKIGFNEKKLPKVIHIAGTNGKGSTASILKTINEQLPEDFQTAEYLLEHGMIDIVVHRKELRETLSKVLSFLKK